MWILLVIFLTEQGTAIAYDQGRFTNWRECRDIGVAMVAELDNKYISTCVEWVGDK